LLQAPPGFGSDTRIYYRFRLANGFELAGRSSLAGDANFELRSQTGLAKDRRSARAGWASSTVRYSRGRFCWAEGSPNARTEVK
jgi:hypothetical protein